MTIIGVDLGTTNSVVAVMEGGVPVVIPTVEGGRLVPSAVAWSPQGEVLTGAVALRLGSAEAGRCVTSAKRFMGLRLDEVAEAAGRAAYRVVASEGGDACFEVGGAVRTPPEIAARLLEALKAQAEGYLGAAVEEAVITVPAYFDDAQRQATLDAGRLAGLKVRRLVNEPTAAAMAYGLSGGAAGTAVVYDLGGGTFDVSVLEVGRDVVEVRATGGDTRLGGDDLDALIVDWICKQAGIAEVGSQARARLREAAERAKIELSAAQEALIHLPFLMEGPGGPVHVEARLDRGRLEAMADPLIDRTLAACRRALIDARIGVQDVDALIFAGGSTRTPRVRARVEAFFGREGLSGINPDEIVALGAAVQAGVLGGEVEDLVLLDVTPLSLGVETAGGVVDRIIARNTRIPVRKTAFFSTGENYQTTLNVHVVQGERQMVADNRSLGRFKLEGIPSALRGVPKIEVAFEVDANGVLTVSARDMKTGASQQMRACARTGLSAEAIERMVEEAERERLQDAERRATVEARREIDLSIEDMASTLDELRPHLSAAQIEQIEGEIARCRAGVEVGDSRQIDKSMKALQKLARKIDAEVSGRSS